MRIIFSFFVPLNFYALRFPNYDAKLGTMFDSFQSPPASSTITGVASMLPMLAAPTFANLPTKQDSKRTTPCVRAGDAGLPSERPAPEIVALCAAA